jgi:hypothetical protein
LCVRRKSRYANVIITVLDDQSDPKYRGGG